MPAIYDRKITPQYGHEKNDNYHDRRFIKERQGAKNRH